MRGGAREGPVVTLEQLALASIGEIVLTLDADLRCTFANPRAAEFLDSLDLPQDLLRRVLAGAPQVWESRAAERTFEFRAWPAPEGLVLLGIDVTLRRSEQRFRAVMEQSPLSTQMLTPDGRTVAVNRAWEDLWGLTLENLRDYDMLQDPQLEERGVADYIRRGFAGEATAIPAIRYDPLTTVPDAPPREDPARWVEGFIYPIKDEAGTIVEVVLVHHDITLQHRAEEELHRKVEEMADADRRKNEFLAMLGHELRNPLAPILNAVEMLRLRPESLPWARDLINRQVGQLTRLVDDLLEVSRISRGQIQLIPQDVDLADTVARVVEANPPRQALSLDLGSAPLLVRADPVRLSQIVGNLVHNAAKYTKDDGHIEIATRAEGTQAVLEVQDDGVGIPPHLLPQVFELFFQADRSLDRSQGGLGIGLTLVKRLVDLHGGEVQAFSEGLGRGSRFEVRLPLSAPSAPAPPEESPALLGGSRRILVVDDNHDAAESLQMVLEMQGHEVFVAHDGPAALEAAARHRPDLVLLDIGLPGLDGYEVAARLRQDPATAGARLVALTGYGHEEVRQRALAAGFDAHFAKPVAVAALLSGSPIAPEILSG